MELTEDDVFFIMKTFDSSDYETLDLKIKDFHITINKSGAAGRGSQAAALPPATVVAQPPRSHTPDPAPAPVDATAHERPAGAPEDLASSGSDLAHRVTSPMLGTFYRSPSPGAAAFVEVGDMVKAGDPLCLIEVMKTYSTVSADMAGKIVRVCAAESQMVQADDVLFLIEPSTP